MLHLEITDENISSMETIVKKAMLLGLTNPHMNGKETRKDISLIRFLNPHKRKDDHVVIFGDDETNG